jgi:hypothetical protein
LGKGPHHAALGPFPRYALSLLVVPTALTIALARALGLVVADLTCIQITLGHAIIAPRGFIAITRLLLLTSAATGARLLLTILLTAALLRALSLGTTASLLAVAALAGLLLLVRLAAISRVLLITHDHTSSIGSVTRVILGTCFMKRDEHSQPICVGVLLRPADDQATCANLNQSRQASTLLPCSCLRPRMFLLAEASLPCASRNAAGSRGYICANSAPESIR